MKLIIKQFFFYLMLLGYLNINAQNTECPVFTFANDLAASNTEFKTLIKEPNIFKAWDILNKENPAIRTNLEELNLVSKNLGEIKNTGGYLKWKALQGAGRHANWVEVLDIRTKILAKKSHVLEVEGLNKTRNYNGTTMEGFTGCHSDQALSDYVAANGGTYRINGKPTNLQADEVFEGQPIIALNGKEYVKTNGQPIVEYSTGKYGGTSTFFPENWNNSKILDEVEYAIANNHGVAPGNNPSEYFGFSRDGKVEIHFYLNNDGTIGSYFPKKR